MIFDKNLDGFTGEPHPSFASQMPPSPKGEGLAVKLTFSAAPKASPSGEAGAAEGGD